MKPCMKGESNRGKDRDVVDIAVVTKDMGEGTDLYFEY